MNQALANNPYKYNGKELESKFGLEMYDYGARAYDPQIGRFLRVDPMAAFDGQDVFSPYAAMRNTPESNVDPNGLMPTDKSKFGYGYAYLDFASTEGRRGGGTSSVSGQEGIFLVDGGFVKKALERAQDSLDGGIKLYILIF